MTKGLYLTIGLNSLDPEKYNGERGELKACENDAKAIANIAKTMGFSGKTLLTKDASSSAVLAGLYEAANTLESGDMLVVGYSGHGSQIGDVTSEEDDGLDETWCLYDRMLIDDELYAMWAKFKTGVRIFVLSDSCHSGTVTKRLELNLTTAALERTPELAAQRQKWGWVEGGFHSTAL